MRFRTLTRAIGALVLGTVALSGCNGLGGSGLILRRFEPVVMTGAQLPSLIGTPTADIVAFRWNRETRLWEQVPVQVDERHVEYLAKLRNGTGTSGPQALAYSDVGANVGTDPTAGFDSNDELVFMTDDTGAEAPLPLAPPANVLASSALQVAVTDPLATGDSVRGTGLGVVYLFKRTGSALQPSAGRDYVTYDFDPDDPMGHAEDSTVSTDRYGTHFAARWVRDELRLGGGPDLLDRHRNLFGVGVCTRSEDTFSAGDGGYATNIDGPVRAIRSYLGANSGTYTQREHLFYRGSERVTTYLRVHAIPGILDFYDYSAAAIGMTYRSSSTPAGVLIDGVPDVAGSALPTWEAVDGPPGRLVSGTTLQTDIAGLATGSYYTDDDTPPATQCTGDAFEYGASGTAITSGIPNTDPTLASPKTFTSTRWNLYSPPGPTKPSVTDLVANLASPLTTSVTTP